MLNVNNRPGQFYTFHKRRVMNRSGGSVSVGDVLALDLQAAETETSDGNGVGNEDNLDVQDAVFHNAVAVATANIMNPIVVVTGLLSGEGGDDTEIEVGLCFQRRQVLVESTSDISRGDQLKPTNGESYLVVRSGGDAERAVAYALEDRSSDDTGLIDACFWGGLPFAGATGTA